MSNKDVIGFRPTADDRRILDAATRDGETTTDVIRRALKLLEHKAWQDQALTDMARLAEEDLNADLDADGVSPEVAAWRADLERGL
jgi:hypothetical protein